MNKYKEIILNEPKAISYIRECLGYGHTLSKYIIETINLDTGQVTTNIPENGYVKNVYNFKYGGIVAEPPESEWRKVTAEDGNKAIWVPKKTVLSPVVEAIRLFLENDSGRICIFDDTLAKSTDPVLKNKKSYVRTFKDEVYHLISTTQSTSKEIEEVIHGAKSLWPPLIGILTSILDEYGDSVNRKKITSTILKTMAEKTEKIIVSAYDGEGFLIWNRNINKR